MIESKELGFIFIYLGSFGLSDLFTEYLNIKNKLFKFIYYLLLFLLGIYVLYK